MGEIATVHQLKNGITGAEVEKRFVTGVTSRPVAARSGAGWRPAAADRTEARTGLAVLEPALQVAVAGPGPGIDFVVTAQLVSGTATLGSQAPLVVQRSVRSCRTLRPCLAPVWKLCRYRHNLQTLERDGKCSRRR